MRFFLLSYYLLLFTSAAFAQSDENSTTSMAPSSPADENSATSMAPSPVPRVFTGKECTTIFGCDCPEGDCNMPFCGVSCHCGGGGCSIAPCAVDCFCPGGDCYFFLRSDLSMKPEVSYDACTSTGTCYCGERGCDLCDGGGCTCSGGACNLKACTENCSCNGGNCKMASCTKDCQCSGGNCNMKDCTENCSCPGGNCDMRSCTKGCSCSGGNCDAAGYQTFQLWAAGLATCLALFLSMD
jgi:hypothetical protein